MNKKFVYEHKVYYDCIFDYKGEIGVFILKFKDKIPLIGKIGFVIYDDIFEDLKPFLIFNYDFVIDKTKVDFKTIKNACLKSIKGSHIQIPNNKPVCHIENVDIFDDYRNNRHSYPLISSFLEFTSDMFSLYTLNVESSNKNVDNTKLIEIYSSFGFNKVDNLKTVEVGINEVKEGKKLNTILMYK